MAARPSLSIVIPCYNEEAAIPRVMQQLDKVRGELALRTSFFEVVVVDDGSTDGSAELLAARSDVRFLRKDGPCGYGAALKKGFSAASGELVAFLDMDGTYDPADLPLLLDALERTQADIVLGSRLNAHHGLSWVRKLGNLFFSRSVQILFRQPPMDVCTGFRVLRKASLPPDYCLPQNGLNYSLALTLRMILSGAKLVETPISYDFRMGKSKLDVPRDGLRFFSTIVKHYCLSYID